ncbi:Uncharacterized protein APZ42_025699 [Daphnia magna]|uniref:Uncharacterized protein n=1 Tax=Daphnia magna TaxID=35525 RepID=A0A164SRR3_9CRUS|nr:Uncharacterized protein APZ42_025699 [Daphnia magna]
MKGQHTRAFPFGRTNAHRGCCGLPVGVAILPKLESSIKSISNLKITHLFK